MLSFSINRFLNFYGKYLSYFRIVDCKCSFRRKRIQRMSFFCSLLFWLFGWFYIFLLGFFILFLWLICNILLLLFKKLKRYFLKMIIVIILYFFTLHQALLHVCLLQNFGNRNSKGIGLIFQSIYSKLIDFLKLL